MRVEMDNPITPKLAAATVLSTQFIDAVLERHEATAQNDLRRSAPWTDRTANARQGLFARHFVSGSERGLVLYHTVTYGIFLETRFSGRFRVIMPVVNRTGREVMRSLRGLLRAVSAGGGILP